MSKKYTYEQVKEIVESKEYILVSEEYINVKENLILKDNDGYYYEQNLDNLLHCEKLHAMIPSNSFSIQNIKLWLKLNNKPYELITKEYVSNKIPLIIKDYNGYFYQISLDNLKRGKIPPLASKRNPYTIQNLKLWCKLNNKNFELISEEYIGNSHKLKWKCLKNNCGKIFYSSWININHGEAGCPYCHQSKGENKINNYLKDNNIANIPQKKFKGLVGLGGGKLSYDFYLPDYNLLIEYQGKYHDGTADQQTEDQFKKQQKHDELKKLYAEDNDIKLLPIWYWDYDKINNILQNQLNLENTSKELKLDF